MASRRVFIPLKKDKLAGIDSFLCLDLCGNLVDTDGPEVSSEKRAEDNCQTIILSDELTLTLTMDDAGKEPKSASLRVGNKELSGSVERLVKPLALCRPITHPEEQKTGFPVKEFMVYGFVTRKVKFDTRPTHHWTWAS